MSLRFNLDEAALKRFAEGSEVKNYLEQQASAVANDARALAPKRTGAMAASIDYEIVDGDDGLEARVSFDQDHFYGIFAELGTSEQSAQPFLRPALDARRS